MGLHEIIDPAVERRLRRRVVDLAVMIAGNGKDRHFIVSVRLVELRVIIIVHAGKVDDVADVIAELRRAALAAGQIIDHVLGDIALVFAVLHAAGIADDMKDHLALDLGRDVRKILGDVVVIGRQTERPRQRLEADIAMGDGVQRADAAMRLGIFGRRPRPHCARPQHTPAGRRRIGLHGTRICRTRSRRLRRRSMSTRRLTFSFGLFHGTLLIEPPSARR